jgi:osmotically-inducible protein OsmY
MFVLAQPLLQGCAPAVVTGIAVGASVIHDRRDATTVIDDQRIELQAMADHFNDPELNSRSRISATSYNYVVLLTGQAQTDEIRQRSAEKVSRLPKVRRVIDEVSLAPSASLARQSEDTLITSRVKLELTSIDLPGFDPMRVKVVTEDGIVYLMGLVSAEEADAAVEKARYVPGVKKVVKVFEYINPSPPQA